MITTFKITDQKAIKRAECEIALNTFEIALNTENKVHKDIV
jgi:hypothetical protein